MTENQKPKNYFKKLLILFFGVTILVAGFGFGYSYGISDWQKSIDKSNISQNNDKIDFDLFWETWNYVKENSVKGDISDKQLFYGALEGIVASIKDPYSIFLEPETAEKFDDELSGSFEGIGAEIGIKKNQLTVIAPLPGTPAQKAGLMAGDFILSIDGTDTSGIALDFAVSKIRGPKGTEVTLMIFREGGEEPFEVKIVRDKIDIVSVRWEMKSGDVAYIELMYFNGDTLEEFNKIVSRIIDLKPEAVILDLRNNPGGYLQTAVEVAGAWIEKDVVVYEKGRDETKFSHKANGKARFKNLPTVVLINGGSASGSEIVAGALQDYKVATLVGETSFGKGSVQDLVKLSDGSSIKLTVAEWYTPSGRNINQEGIEPDIAVELTKDDYDNDRDPQLDKALEILK
ncbi:S41 family peptidase [Candidatus Parcubacteria bacterium]|nr:MAG: S41 family peptidase [Candidatus Parcubacteria bacterium]